MTEPNLVSDSGQEIVRVALALTNRRVRDLETQLIEAQQIQQAWGDIVSFANKGWPLHVLAVLDEPIKSLLISSAPDSEATAATLTELHERASAQMRGLNRRFPALLEKACEQADIVLDPESRHPIYSIDQHFFQLIFNADKQTVRLSDVESRLDEVPADMGAVIEVIQRERKRIFERPFIGHEFVRKLYSHYQAVLKSELQADGAVTIRAITRRLGKNEKGFRTDEFVVDLSRLLTDGPLEIDGRRLDLQQTKDTNQGILLRGDAGRGYVGFIVFRKVGA